MTLRGTYYSFLGVNSTGSIFSVFTNTAGVKIKNNRIVCHGDAAVLPKHTPVIVTGEYDQNADVFIVTDFQIDMHPDSFSTFLSEALQLTDSAIKNIFKVFDSYRIFHINSEDKKFLLEKGICSTDIDKMIVMFSGIKRALQTYQDCKRFFMNAEISHNLCVKYHDSDMLINEPYEVGYEIGASLYICDVVAEEYNRTHDSLDRICNDSPQRIKYIAKACAEEISSNGNTCISFEEYDGLLTRIESSGKWISPNHEFLLIATTARNYGLKLMTIDHRLVVYVTEFLYIEEKVTSFINDILHRSYEPIPVDENLIQSYDEGQKEAIKGCLNSAGLSVITGRPGTGKTTVIKAIAKSIQEAGQTFKLCAPTGRAAARIQEDSKMPATTIHKLVGIRCYSDEPKDMYASYNEFNPLSADCIIADEASMISLDIFLMLLKALKPGAKLILVGDPDQLPSVSPGNVLADIIKSQICPIYKLSTIHRQKGKSSIISNAYKILDNDGKDLEEDKSFRILRPDTPEEALQILIDIFNKEYNVKKPYGLQTLTAYREGTAGKSFLNSELLDTIGLRTGRTKFCKGDKIMTIKNHYDLSNSYSNGDIGIVDCVTHDGIYAKMAGKNRTTLIKQTADIDFAYACTIHKSQGSEYDHVVIVLDTTHPAMLYKNLIYTAVTRAKKNITIIDIGGESLKIAASTPAPIRYSGLAQRLTSIAQ